MDLKLNSARSQLSKLKATQEYNLAFVHLENYIDFFEIFISENKTTFKILEKNKNLRIEIINKHLEVDNPYRRFIEAEINLQWALSRAKFNQLFKAGREIFKAYSLLETNKSLHPEFIYNNKSLSVIHALIETINIPGFVKNLLGIRGSISLGIEEIREVLEYSDSHRFLFQKEAEAIYTYIQFYQNNQRKEAFEFIKASSLDHKESLLANFLKSKIAQRAGFNELALQWLENRPKGSEYSEFHYLELMEGMCKLRALNKDCISHFENFINNFNGQHYIKDAYQKLAWAQLIFNSDENEYRKYMQLVRSEGNDELDADIQAMKESRMGIVPNPILLKSRLLYDGGYYNQSFSLLSQNTNLFVTKHGYLLEFSYRMGRISQALNKYQDAIHYYMSTIRDGQGDSSYLACNAALQLGLIYEEKNELGLAEKYYRKCLDISPDEYKSSLHQKAKTGIQRLLK